MTVQRWKITLQYDGTDYCGWQLQPDGMPTVQEDLENAIYKFCGQNIRVTVAGRTDSGVHAHGQVVHFDLDYGDRPLTGYGLTKALNAHLRPKPVAVMKAEKVSDDFHARFGAKNKLYRYRMVIRSAPPVLDRRFVWHHRYDLDLDNMRKAAAILLGTHDFTSFRDSECQAKSPLRTLDRIDIFEEIYDTFGGKHIIFELEAQSFLHHQCRNIIGTLVKIGKGHIKPDEMKSILEARDRTKAGMTAPACGLSLVRIDY